jgi:hypothetical protein
MRIKLRQPAMAVACIAAAMSVNAQSPAVMVDISSCMALSSTADKQACYLALEARVRAGMAVNNAPIAPAAPPVVVQPTPVPVREVAEAVAPAPQPQPEPQVQEQQVEDFGVHTPAETARIQNNEDGEAELHDTIVSMQQREPGRWLFTLASGQVWYQANTKRIRFRKGDEVRIYPSPIGGSWRMARASGTEVGFIQVDRIR